MMEAKLLLNSKTRFNGTPGPNRMHGNFNPDQQQQFVNYRPQTNLNVNNQISYPRGGRRGGNCGGRPRYSPNVMLSSSTNDCKSTVKLGLFDTESSKDENC